MKSHFLFPLDRSDPRVVTYVDGKRHEGPLEFDGDGWHHISFIYDPLKENGIMIQPPATRFDESDNGRPLIHCACGWTGDEDDLVVRDNDLWENTFHCPKCDEEIDI